MAAGEAESMIWEEKSQWTRPESLSTNTIVLLHVGIIVLYDNSLEKGSSPIKLQKSPMLGLGYILFSLYEQTYGGFVMEWNIHIQNHNSKYIWHYWDLSEISSPNTICHCSYFELLMYLLMIFISMYFISYDKASLASVASTDCALVQPPSLLWRMMTMPAFDDFSSFSFLFGIDDDGGGDARVPILHPMIFPLQGCSIRSLQLNLY